MQNRLYNVRGKFFEALRDCISNSNKKGCINKRDLTIGHKISEEHILEQPHPEVFMLNLTWIEEPLPSDIVKTLVSVPEMFETSELFSGRANRSTYVLRGLINYQSGHYFSYQRKIFIKYDFLDVNYQTLREDLTEMEREVSTETEW